MRTALWLASVALFGAVLAALRAAGTPMGPLIGILAIAATGLVILQWRR